MMMYLSLKSAHLIFMVAWFAGLFYLPRLFVYHTQVKPIDEQAYQRFLTMEKKLLHVIMLPATVATIVIGFGLVSLNHTYYTGSLWFHIKMLLVLCLCVFELRCYWHYWQFKSKNNTHSEFYFRCFNEIPTLFLVAIIILVVFKPF